MSKTKKIVISVISLILVLLIGGLGFVGNYFFEYALLRQEGIETAANIDTNAPQSVETVAEVANKEKAREEVDKWLKNVKTEETTIESEDGLKLW